MKPVRQGDSAALSEHVDRVVVDDVTLADRPDDVLDWRLTSPGTGDTAPSYRIRVSGWIVGRHSPVTHLELVENRQIHVIPVDERLPDVAERFPEGAGGQISGFAGSLSALRWLPEFELALRARFADGKVVKLGSVRGHRSHLPVSGGLQPVLVTSYGRSGSTWLLHVLGQHPEIVTYEPFTHEPRVMMYWFELFAAVSEPASYLQAIRARRESQPWWLGSRDRPLDVHVADAAIEDAIGGSGVERHVEFATERVDRFYRAAADATGKRRAALFAEKGPWDDVLWRVIGEVYPGAREVFLVRDLRDMVASIFAYNAKRETQAFGRDRVDSDEEFIDRLAHTMRNLLRDYETRSARATLLRYEDLILKPEQALPELFAGIGVESSPATVGRVIDAAKRDLPQMDFHRTAFDSRASIGRWKDDLPPALRKRANERFAEIHAGFGYAP